MRRHQPAASSRSTISQNIVWIALKSSSAFIMDCISFSIYFRSGCIKHEPRSPPSESAILHASYGSSSSRRSTRDSEPSLLASCFSFSIYWLFEFPVSTFIVQHHCCGRKENVHHWFLRKSALGGQRPSTATPIRASFCHRTGACRSLSQPLFRISRNQGVTH